MTIQIYIMRYKMKSLEKNMIHIRLNPDFLKKLKILSIQKELSMQKFVENVIIESVLKYDK